MQSGLGSPERAPHASKYRIHGSLLSIVHGAVTMGKSQGIVFWASDLAVGILSIPNLLTGEIVYARISITARQAGPAN